MGNAIEKNQLKKLKPFYRVFCFFISICSFIGLLGAITFGAKESPLGALLASLVPLTLLYVCVPVIFTGYPPKRLQWTMSKR